jgi:hypothetical protein
MSEQVLTITRQLIYMNFFLVHLCAIRNIDLVFVADEVCSILKITPEQLEAARKKRYIRCGVFDHKFIYHAADMVLLAELLGRKTVLSKNR